METKVCRVCGESKALIKFAKRAVLCRKCSKIGAHKANTIKLNSYLEGKCCTRCGIQDTDVLCFHHKDPKTKRNSVSNMKSLSWSSIEEEISKCEILCHNCHAIEHGVGETRRSYSRNNKYTGICKKCVVCGKEMDTSNFYGRSAKCINCNYRIRLTTIRKNREYIEQYTHSKCCIHCGNSQVKVLQFHHKDPSTKEYNVSSMLEYSIKKIDKELSKCDILCANCHIKLHKEEVKTNANP